MKKILYTFLLTAIPLFSSQDDENILDISEVDKISVENVENNIEIIEEKEKYNTPHTIAIPNEIFGRIFSFILQDPEGNFLDKDPNSLNYKLVSKNFNELIQDLFEKKDFEKYINKIYDKGYEILHPISFIKNFSIKNVIGTSSNNLIEVKPNYNLINNLSSRNMYINIKIYDVIDFDENFINNLLKNNIFSKNIKNIYLIIHNKEKTELKGGIESINKKTFEILKKERDKLKKKLNKFNSIIRTTYSPEFDEKYKNLEELEDILIGKYIEYIIHKVSKKKENNDYNHNIILKSFNPIYLSENFEKENQNIIKKIINLSVNEKFNKENISPTESFLKDIFDKIRSKLTYSAVPCFKEFMAHAYNNMLENLNVSFLTRGKEDIENFFEEFLCDSFYDFFIPCSEKIDKQLIDKLFKEILSRSPDFNEAKNLIVRTLHFLNQYNTNNLTGQDISNIILELQKEYGDDVADKYSSFNTAIKKCSSFKKLRLTLKNSPFMTTASTTNTSS
jgi:hypothetical protein